MKYRQTILGLLFVVLVSACGGGGGGGGGGAPSGPVISTLSFPLRTAYSTLIANGFTKNFAVSGTCSGSANVTQGAALGGATFEGVPGRLSAVSTTTINLSNCTPASLAATTTLYFDSNYVPLGTHTAGGNYAVYLTPPILPVSAMVGEKGIIGTLTQYTDSTKTVAAGRDELSYVVEADTASTSIVNLTTKSYNASNVLTLTEQDRYRIAATGPVTLISIDTQAANGSTTHLIFQ